MIDELFLIGEPSCSPIPYLIVINVWSFFTPKKALKRPFKAILKPVKHLSLFTYPHSSFTLFCPALSEIKNEKLFIHIPTNPLNSPFFGVIRLYSLTLFFSFFFSDYTVVRFFIVFNFNFNTDINKFLQISLIYLIMEMFHYIKPQNIVVLKRKVIVT